MNDKSNKRITIDISSKTFLKLFLFIVGIILLYYIRHILALLFVTMIIVAGLDPLVNWLVKQKVPQLMAVIMAYLMVFAFLGLLIYLIIPPVIEQIININNNIPYFINKLDDFNINLSNILLSNKGNLSQVSSQLAQLSGGVINTVVVIFGGAASAVTVLVLSFYLLLERKIIREFILALIPPKKKDFIISVAKKMIAKLGSWVRGQIMLALIIGVAVFIALKIIGVPYALTLAIIAGILEIIPVVGPIVSGVVAGLVALVAGSWWQVLAVVISYIAIQQLESNILVPKIMGKAVGLSPVIIIIALMIGAKLGGILGAVIAIPVAAVSIIFIQEWFKHHAEDENQGG